MAGSIRLFAGGHLRADAQRCPACRRARAPAVGCRDGWATSRARAPIAIAGGRRRSNPSGCSAMRRQGRAGPGDRRTRRPGSPARPLTAAAWSRSGCSPATPTGSRGARLRRSACPWLRRSRGRRDRAGPRLPATEAGKTVAGGRQVAGETCHAAGRELRPRTSGRSRDATLHPHLRPLVVAPLCRGHGAGRVDPGHDRDGERRRSGSRRPAGRREACRRWERGWRVLSDLRDRICRVASLTMR